MKYINGMLLRVDVTYFDYGSAVQGSFSDQVLFTILIIPERIGVALRVVQIRAGTRT